MKKTPEPFGIPFRPETELGIPTKEECRALVTELGWTDPNTGALTEEMGVSAFRIVRSARTGDIEYLLGREMAKQTQAMRIFIARLGSVLNDAASKLEEIRAQTGAREMVAVLREAMAEDAEFKN